MRVVVFESAESVTQFAADQVCRVIQTKNVPTLGLATGGTPLGLYRELIERHRKGLLSFKHVNSFNLDEYLGLSPDDDRSYHAYMRENLFKHIDIDLGHTHIPKTDRVDLDQSACEFEKAIADCGGIDLQILGIGSDGHIGFNEPGSSLASRTRIKSLTQRTRADNARYFKCLDEVPKMALTMGIGTIMESKSVMLLATGESKAQAIRDTVEGPISAMVPSSILQMHPQTTLAIDTAAASSLKNIEYYLESEQNRVAQRTTVNIS